jgi:hypothetical protein
VTALADLVAAVRSQTVLAWCLRHAPDGDTDAAVARAWAACDDPFALLHVARRVDYDVWRVAFAAYYAHVRDVCGRPGAAGSCDAIRAAVAAPPRLADLLPARATVAP